MSSVVLTEALLYNTVSAIVLDVTLTRFSKVIACCENLFVLACKML